MRGFCDALKALGSAEILCGTVRTNDLFRDINRKIVTILLNENIPAHFKNTYYASRCQSLYDTKSVCVEKTKDGVYINEQKTFKLKDNNWKICLPNLMENE